MSANKNYFLYPKPNELLLVGFFFIKKNDLKIASQIVYKTDIQFFIFTLLTNLS